MSNLYINIKRRREELNMSQMELAKKLGYKDRSTIAKIESGENDLTQSKILAFAEVLQTTPAQLMGWEEKQDIENNTITDDDIIRIQRARSKMNDSEKAHMMQTLTMLYHKYFDEDFEDTDTEE